MSEGRTTESKFAEARDSLQQTLGKLRGCSDRERKEMQREFAQLNEMLSKLDKGQVEIVVFGEISTGKSALINALIGEAVADVDVQGGWTRDVQSSEWKTCAYRVPGLNDSGVLLVDTPGINEVEGQQRASLAEEAARRADLILFVTDSDLNEIEHEALKHLASLKKPLLIVLNKKDLYSEDQRNRLLDVLTRERLPGLLPTDHVVLTSADPREVEYIIEDAEGKTRQEWRRPQADVQALKEKILEILDRDGLALVALNAAMYAADQTDRIAALRIELRNHLANRVIGGYAAVKALVVGWSPAAVDIIGGGLVDASMVGVLAKIYGLDLSWQHARKLASAIGQATGWVILGETVSYLGASLFKGLTLGLATPLTAIPQGAASGFASYIVGQSAKYYFEHGASWGGLSPKAVVQQILDQTDRDSVLGHLKDEIKQKMLFNPHARKP